MTEPERWWVTGRVQTRTGRWVVTIHTSTGRRRSIITDHATAHGPGLTAVVDDLLASEPAGPGADT